MKKQSIGLLFLATLLFVSCHNKADLDANGMPQELVIAHFNTGDSPALKKALEPMRQYLQKKLGIPVIYVYFF